MKFRIIETRNPRTGTTLYTVQKAFRGWFGIGTIWAGTGEEPLSYRALGGDWTPKRFLNIKEAEAAIEKYKQNSLPVEERIVKEIV